MKRHQFLIGLFSVLGLSVIAQGPMDGYLESTNPPEKNRYEIEKSAYSTTEFADFGAYFHDDKLYFLSDRKTWPVSWKDEEDQPFLDLFVADLENGGVEFAGKNKNGKLNEGPICFSKDGARVYYTRDNDAKKAKNEAIQLALYTAKVKDGKWIDEQKLSINDPDYSFGHPVLSSDGKYLYFCSNQPGGLGGTDIYRTTVLSDGNVSKEMELLPGDVNTPGNELFPAIGSNQELYFSSTGHKGLGGLDIFMALYKGDRYTRVTNVGRPVNSPKDDFAYSQGKSNRGYFSTNRDGNDDIYSYHLRIPFQFVPIVSGIVAIEDSESKEGVVVELLDLNENVINSQVTNAKGNYSFDLEEEKQYMVRYSKEGYDPLDIKVSTKGEGFGLANDITLKKDNGVEISLQLFALKTGLAVEGAKVRIKDNLKNKVFLQKLSDPSGRVAEPMILLKEGDSLDLSIRIAKEGYLTKEVRFQYKLNTMEDIPLEEFFGKALKMNRTGIALGDKMSDLIDLNKVEFEDGVEIVTPQVADELNKVVTFLKENPSIHIRLEAHTDSRGDAASNMTLSTKRAQSCKSYLQIKGIESYRISTRGFGEKEILNHCKDDVECTEEEHLENQRVEVVITKD